ncbi:MAG TPA: nuclear transport factor 2 family protein [Candidatus Dormibacteraeota bacterium]|nr:nuclear transport factor 2 family protein [Candidatus Dormibacteraeota bacterium]
MNRDFAISLLDRLHRAQNDFYSGGGAADLEQLLSPDVTWTIPGNNLIAATYRGLGEVLEYFRRRREIANNTLRLVRRDVLVGEGDRIAAVTDGFATIGGVERHWSTVGLYEISAQRIAACWLLALDQRVFDAIWGRP